MPEDDSPELQKSLKSRHMTMISLGGVIGAEREAPERLKVRMWAFPYLTYFAIAAMVAVLASMALVKDVRAQLIPSFISLAIVLVAYWFKTRAERSTATASARGTA